MKTIAETKELGIDLNGLQKINSNHEISLWLDSYDDIFSDFDPRPFSTRNISDDFLYEIKKITRETEFSISELKLLIPDKLRSAESEGVITKRLHSYFNKSLHYYLKKKKTERKKGFLLSVCGIILMAGASYVSSKQSQNILMHTLLVVLEPAGWFLLWFGMEYLINVSRKEKRELDFYSKMSKSKIVFLNI